MTSDSRSAATLLFLDLAESVRLMEDDEAGLVARWREVVGVIDREILPKHDGRLIKSMGDGLILEFDKPQRMVKAAFHIQSAFTAANAGVSADRQMLVRMGAHIGQVIVDEHDVYGRGLNLASRLTALAGPGEIVVSADVRDQLTPMLDADVEDLGLCYLKHVPQPVRAYRVGPPGPQPVIDVGASVIAELRPTVAVIPFSSHDAIDHHRVVGELLAEEIISALSRADELNVVSRLSTTVFRDRNSPLAEVARCLDATYVCSGSYRVVGKNVKGMVEVAHSGSGKVVWSDKVEGAVAGIMSGKGGVVHAIVTGLSGAIMNTELQRAQSRPLPTLESYTLLIAAITLMHRLSQTDFDRARSMLQAVIDRTPREATPWAWLAKWHVLRVQQGWSEDPVAETQQAMDCVRRALQADSQCVLALAIDGMVHTNLLRQLDVGLERYELALSLNPNDAFAWLLKGTLHAFRGEGKLAVDGANRALRLSPFDPHRYFYDSLAATAALSAGHYARAIDLAKRSLKANRTHTSTYRALAISQWLSGQHDEARNTVRTLRKLEPTLTVRNYLQRSPSNAYETGQIWSSALHQAGLPA